MWYKTNSKSRARESPTLGQTNPATSMATERMNRSVHAHTLAPDHSCRVVPTLQPRHVCAGLLILINPYPLHMPTAPGSTKSDLCPHPLGWSIRAFDARRQEATRTPGRPHTLQARVLGETSSPPCVPCLPTPPADSAASMASRVPGGLSVRSVADLTFDPPVTAHGSSRGDADSTQTCSDAQQQPEPQSSQGHKRRGARRR
jgi:hypothetical protein